MTTFTLTNGADTFPGLGQDNTGDDVINGLAGMDVIFGGSGNDLINGGTGRDRLFGDAGDDVIDLGLLPVNDVANGGAGLDLVVIHYEGVVDPGTGNPVRVEAHFSTGLWATSVDGISGGSLANFERLQFDTGDGADNLWGGSGDDVISAAGGDDILRGGDGNDRISDSWGAYDADGGDGIDTLVVSGANAKDPGAGLQFLVFPNITFPGTITAGTSASGGFINFEKYEVTGTSNNDFIQLGQGDDRAFGGKGHDEFAGGGGNDYLDGGLGFDFIYGARGNDVLHTGELTSTTAAQADDRLFGGDGDDLLYADTSAQGGTLRSYAGAVFDGGSGNDTLQIQDLVATIDLTGATITGIETFSYGTSFLGNALMTAAQVNAITNFNSYKITIMTAGDIVMSGNPNLTEIRLFEGGQSIDLSASVRPSSNLGPRVVGGNGDDFLMGSSRLDDFLGGAGNDTLIGGFGADVLTAGAGNDSLYGGEHNDFLTGDAGVDFMSGGAGRDIFDFNAMTDSGNAVGTRDVITDFQVDPNTSTAFVDRFDLSTIDAKASTLTNDMFTFIGSAAFFAEGQVRAIQNGANTLLLFNTSGSGGAEMTVVIGNFIAASLTSDDFFE